MSNAADVLKRVRPIIQSLRPYQVKEVGEGIVLMDKNENPYDLPESMKSAIMNEFAAKTWSRYPPIVATGLHEKIARYAGWKPDGVIAGNGSDEIILITLLTFLEPGKRVIVPSPSFAMFKYIASIIGAEVVEVPLTDTYDYDIQAMKDAVDDGADMLILCSPNNPTGGLFPLEHLETVIGGTDMPVIIDEAYFEFSGQTALEYIDRYPNLILFRTFSKAFSLAGQRIGYALMDPSMAVEIGKVKLPFNLDLFSITAATHLMENPLVIREAVKTISIERDRLIDEMSAMDGVTVFDTAANFILFRTPYESGDVFDGLLADGLLVRDFSAHPAMHNTLRVTTSLAEHNDAFIASLTRILGEFARKGA